MFFFSNILNGMQCTVHLSAVSSIQILLIRLFLCNVLPVSAKQFHMKKVGIEKIVIKVSNYIIHANV